MQPDVRQQGARDLLVGWANGQDSWARTITAEVIATRSTPSQTTVDAIKETFYLEKGLNQGLATIAPKLGDGGSGDATPSKLRLERLHECKNVNKLSDSQSMTFGRKLTVFFGENASGKTGYVRILKRISGVRGAQRVLPDIGKTTQTGPSARIAFSIDAVPHETEWKDQLGLSPFTRIAVFDSPAVSVHLNENLDYVFTPADLSLFQLVHETICQVRDAIQEDIQARRPKGNTFLTALTRGTEPYKIVETLSGATPVAAVRAMADLSPAQQEEIRQLQLRVEALNPRSIEATLKRTKDSLSRLQRFKHVAQQVASIDTVQYENSVTSLNKAEAEAANLVDPTQNAPAEERTALQEFIQAGERLARESRTPDFPTVGDTCLYCDQPLTEAAAEVVRTYRKYSAAHAVMTIPNLQQNISTRLSPVTKIETIELRASLPNVKDEAWSEDARSLLLQVEALKNAERKTIEPQDLTEAVRTSANLVELLDSEISERSTDLEAARASSEERDELLKAAEKRLEDLNDRVKLRSMLPEVEQHIRDNAWCQRAEILVGKFQGVLKSITSVSKQASERALQKDFVDRFNDERRVLRAPEVKLEFPGRKGQTIRRKTVASDYRLDEILSEGEQKVIALSDFLAEALLREGSAPLIFDDPVNSLDYKRLHEVVDRLADLSEQQQVIVFTHNIWFTAELLSKFEKNGEDYKYYDVEAFEGVKGIVTSSSGPRIDSLKQTSRQITDTLDAASKAQGTVRAALVAHAYECMRNWCEMFVEGEMLKNVAERYSPHVGVTKLRQISFDRLNETSNRVIPLYEKCCRQIKSHSQPKETLNVRADLSEAQSDWQAALDAQQFYRGT